jgi:hypothetical protein
VLDVSGGNIKHTYKTFNAKGEESSSKEKTTIWSGIKLTFKLPYNTKVDWTEETLTLSGKELLCDVATYKSGETLNVLYYSNDVPCGGFVKIMLDGKETNWLSAFNTAKSGEVKETPKDPVVETKSQLPRFYAARDNSAVIKISGTGRDTNYQLRQITEVGETSSKYTAVTCDAEGTPIEGAKPTDREQKKEDWDKLYAKPIETAVKLTVEAGEFVCDVFKTTADGKETTEWVSEGAPVKKVIKSGGTETVMEAVKITMK